MTNRVDRTLRRGSDRRNVDIDCVYTQACPWQKIPPSGASWRGRARPRKTHHPTLRAPGRDVIPTLKRRFLKTRRTIIHDETRGRCSRILERRARGKNEITRGYE